MKSKTLGIIVIIGSLCSSLLWIIGIIKTNIFNFIASMIILGIIGIISIKNYDQLNDFFTKRNGKVREDEMSRLIDGKSSTATLGISTALFLYIGIGVLTLRNVYPDIINIGLTLIVASIIQIIVGIITNYYYKNKF